MTQRTALLAREIHDAWRWENCGVLMGGEERQAKHDTPPSRRQYDHASLLERDAANEALHIIRNVVFFPRTELDQHSVA